MSISYYYFGNDSLKRIHVGEGRGAWERWGLMDHEGPTIRPSLLGYSSDRRTYLPRDFLELLYGRFAAENPSGATLVRDEGYMPIALKRYSEEELEELAEKKEALVIVNEWEPGYPLLRPYLPELYEPGAVERLAKDPWLDADLLWDAERLGSANGGIAPDLWVDRSARWSPEWRAYCDRLESRRQGNHAAI